MKKSYNFKEDRSTLTQTLYRMEDLTYELVQAEELFGADLEEYKNKLQEIIDAFQEKLKEWKAAQNS